MNTGGVFILIILLLNMADHKVKLVLLGDSGVGNQPHNSKGRAQLLRGLNMTGLMGSTRPIWEVSQL